MRETAIIYDPGDTLFMRLMLCVPDSPLFEGMTRHLRFYLLMWSHQGDNVRFEWQHLQVGNMRASCYARDVLYAGKLSKLLSKVT